MGVIGHNGGPSIEPGQSWRSHCWRAARAQLLPTLPIEVVRLRVKRARSLGLDYKTYASVRASSGHDLVAFLFSSNALRISPLHPAMPADRAAHIAGVEADRLALATAPLAPDLALAANPELTAAYPAPFALASFGQARAILRAALGNIPSDRVLLIGDLALEAEWSMAGHLAGYLAADRYFAPCDGR